MRKPMNIEAYRRKLLATGRYVLLKGWGIYPKDMSHRLEEEGD